jgi:hypothetical protein
MNKILKNCIITKKLEIDRREWKLAIHMSETLSLVHHLLLHFNVSFLLVLFTFCKFHFFYCIFSFFCLVFIDLFHHLLLFFFCLVYTHAI